MESITPMCQIGKLLEVGGEVPSRKDGSVMIHRNSIIANPSTRIQLKLFIINDKVGLNYMV